MSPPTFRFRGLFIGEKSMLLVWTALQPKSIYYDKINTADKWWVILHQHKKTRPISSGYLIRMAERQGARKALRGNRDALPGWMIEVFWQLQDLPSFLRQPPIFSISVQCHLSGCKQIV